MRINYVGWAIAALLLYSFYPPLVTAGMRQGDVPSAVAAWIANTVVVIVVPLVLFFTEDQIFPYVTQVNALYFVVGGLFLTAAVLSLYTALSVGPVSTVIPIFGMYIIFSSAIGFAFFDETLTLQKVAGIGFAILAIYFASGSGG